ncbi:hypothetical protein C8J57DRAFT_1245117 [Mycena rebaudengoi]|nr:hypothetical protein C8J57DRAFT_1245117 [Mycena rebaudengoi]
MASIHISDAVVPWDPHPNLAVMKTEDNSRLEGRRALILNGLLYPSPGRTLDWVYTSLAKVLEARPTALRTALAWDCTSLVRKLNPTSEMVKNELGSWNSCALPSHQNSRNGLNQLIPSLTHSRISWRMSLFFRDSGDCVSMQNTWKHCSGALIFFRALCIRYLGGILDLPGFWAKLTSIHSDVVNKLCHLMSRILKDIGVDILALGPMRESEAPFDYEGVDFLATTILTGHSNWLAKLDHEEWPQQPWFEDILPSSSAFAVGTFEDFLPATYHNAELNVFGKLNPRPELL